MKSIEQFLLARFSEEEYQAREFDACEWSGIDTWGDGWDLFSQDGGALSTERLLVDIQIKREIARIAAQRAPHEGLVPNEPTKPPDQKAYGLRPWTYILRNLARPYQSHPDYNPAWSI